MTQRRQRWLRLSKKRTDNAIYTILSIAKLAKRSNYDYKDDEVWEIVNKLLWEVKGLFLKFSSESSVEDRFSKLIQLDFQQLDALKIYDPELYEFVKGKLTNNKHINVLFDNNDLSSINKEPEFLKTNARMRHRKLKEIHKQINRSEKLVASEIKKIQRVMEK